MRAKRATFTKVYKKCQKWSILTSFWKPEACGQTVLPGRSILIRKNFVENANIQTFKCAILGEFPPMFISSDFLFGGRMKPIFCPNATRYYAPYVEHSRSPQILGKLNR